jgi:hypothetical protein
MVAAKTMVPTIPMTPAVMNGVCGANFHRNPPTAGSE